MATETPEQSVAQPPPEGEEEWSRVMRVTDDVRPILESPKVREELERREGRPLEYFHAAEYSTVCTALYKGTRTLTQYWAKIHTNGAEFKFVLILDRRDTLNPSVNNTWVELDYVVDGKKAFEQLPRSPYNPRQLPETQ